MTNIDLEQLQRELNELKNIKENRDYYKKKCEDFKRQEEIRIKEEMKQKNSIIIGGFGGIHIPLDEVMKKEINDYIYKEIRNIIESDKDFEEQFIKCALNYKKAFINIFKPIVEEIIEDIDFNVSFKNRDE